MNSTGKWYLWKNQAAARREYWTGVCWTADPKKTMFFNTLEEANSEAHHRANRTTECEVVVDQATKNIFEEMQK